MNEVDNKEAPRALMSAVEDSLANIRLGVELYVGASHRSVYRMVAVELRKLLLDQDSVRSFVGSTQKRCNLFEAAFGKGDKIYIQSFLTKSGTVTEDGYISVGPPLYPNSVSIVYSARGDDRLVPLRDWLGECPVRDANGAVRKTSNILQDIADKEGAHVISNWGKKDWRNKAGVAITSKSPREMTPEEIEALPYDANWEQFVIEAGAKLLYARKWEQSQWKQLFDFQIDIPQSKGADETSNVSLSLEQIRRTP